MEFLSLSCCFCVIKKMIAFHFGPRVFVQNHTTTPMYLPLCVQMKPIVIYDLEHLNFIDSFNAEETTQSSNDYNFSLCCSIILIAIPFWFEVFYFCYRKCEIKFWSTQIVGCWKPEKTVSFMSSEAFNSVFSLRYLDHFIQPQYFYSMFCFHEEEKTIQRIEVQRKFGWKWK